MRRALAARWGWGRGHWRWSGHWRRGRVRGCRWRGGTGSTAEAARTFADNRATSALNARTPSSVNS
ncbi:MULTISPECIES: hypothetical protein [unclassified Saccharothrix]|uniref:hypothetical protein n=1 Tax=unclassified Saccharothrix TaxID=2593673 RepID=UPI00307DA335